MLLKNISVVVPLYNEEESINELYDWIKRVLNEHRYSYEIIFVDDGSFDRSWNVIQQIAAADENVKGIKFSRNYGKSAALNTGFKYASGSVVITMDADLQDSPDEIPGLYSMITDENYDLVSGWKKKRHDPLNKTIPSKVFNYFTRVFTGIPIHDFNCGLKAYDQRVVKNIHVYGEMHRYIPYIAKWSGFGKIGERVVEHRPRKYGTTKFGMARLINGFLDLLSITFVSKFKRRPMHFFGSMGTLSFLLGLVITVYLIALKIYKIHKHIPARNITDQPLFFLALVALVIGVQLFLAGFLAEMLSIKSGSKDDYIVIDRVGILQ
ncbi:MAG: glycosyltransferase family 2 protein [Bacteroidota bacterium]|jgi:glycosyltransferase involved in cell wall biosynthesis|nr:glycosyltransferase family 2 protein [Bacteroidota bacterium]